MPARSDRQRSLSLRPSLSALLAAFLCLPRMAFLVLALSALSFAAPARAIAGSGAAAAPGAPAPGAPSDLLPEVHIASAYDALLPPFACPLFRPALDPGAAASIQPPHVSFLPGVHSVVLPMQMELGILLVEASVGDAQASLLLGLDQPRTILDPDLVQSVGASMAGRVTALGMAGATDHSYLWKVDSLRLGELSVGPIDALGMGMSRYRLWLKRPIDGILGWDILSQFVVSFDFLGKSLTLTQPGFAHPSEGARKLPFEPGWDSPVVRAVYDGKHAGRFRVSPGVPFFLWLEGPFMHAKKLWRGSFSDVSHYKVTAAGLLGSEGGLVSGKRRFRLANYAQDLPWVIGFSPVPGDTADDPGIDGQIGEGALDPFDLTFDGPGRTMYVRPRASECQDGLGWKLKQADLRLAVQSVKDDGPAGKAGVQAGDILMRLDGVDLTGLTPGALCTLTDRPTGAVVRFLMRRGTAMRDVVVTLGERPDRK